MKVFRSKLMKSNRNNQIMRKFNRQRKFRMKNPLKKLNTRKNVKLKKRKIFLKESSRYRKK